MPWRSSSAVAARVQLARRRGRAGVAPDATTTPLSSGSVGIDVRSTTRATCSAGWRGGHGAPLSFAPCVALTEGPWTSAARRRAGGRSRCGRRDRRSAAPFGALRCLTDDVRRSQRLRPVATAAGKKVDRPSGLSDYGIPLCQSDPRAQACLGTCREEWRMGKQLGRSAAALSRADAVSIVALRTRAIRLWLAGIGPCALASGTSRQTALRATHVRGLSTPRCCRRSCCRPSSFRRSPFPTCTLPGRSRPCVARPRRRRRATSSVTSCGMHRRRWRRSTRRSRAPSSSPS